MRLGYSLPQIGSIAGPDSLARVARTAEELGFDSVWVLDRVLFPVAPRAPYPATPDGALPEDYQRVLDPIGTLTWVAAITERVSLGTSILCLPFYNPVLLARQLTTLDVLSGGRLRLGTGTAWSPDEFEATGVPMKDRGARTEEALDLLQAIWAGGDVEHKGRFFSLPESVMGLEPVQRPRPRLYMAAYAPATLARAGERADGWMPAGVPNAAIPEMFGAVQAAAAAAGRDPEALELVVRANPVLLDEPQEEKDRFSFVGSFEQVARDLTQLREIGADEVIFDLQFSPGISTVDDHVALMEKLRALED